MPTKHKLKRLHSALMFPCPYCKAEAGFLCVTSRGEVTYEHGDRLKLRCCVENGGAKGLELGERVWRQIAQLKGQASARVNPHGDFGAGRNKGV